MEKPKLTYFGLIFSLTPFQIITGPAPAARSTTQKLDWRDERSPHTKAYDQWRLLPLIGSTITHVARTAETTYDEILGALHRQIAVEVNGKEIKQLAVLGIDEIALKSMASSMSRASVRRRRI